MFHVRAVSLRLLNQQTVSLPRFQSADRCGRRATRVHVPGAPGLWALVGGTSRLDDIAVALRGGERGQDLASSLLSALNLPLEPSGTTVPTTAYVAIDSWDMVPPTKPHLLSSLYPKAAIAEAILRIRPCFSTPVLQWFHRSLTARKSEVRPYCVQAIIQSQLTFTRFRQKTDQAAERVIMVLLRPRRFASYSI